METNQKDYDTRSTRMPQPNQFYEGRDFSPQGGWQQQPRPQQPTLPQNGVRPQQAPFNQSGMGQQQPRPQQTALSQSGVRPQPQKAAAKMPKARVLALANTFKKGLVIASIMGFGMFGGLATLHQVGATTTTTTTASQSTTTSTQTSSSQNSSSFLKQSGTATATSTATATPTNTATATTTPVTGSSTS